MTFNDDPLDRLAPALTWVSDWDDVLQRGGESHRPRVLTRRRLIVAFAVLLAVLVPLAALGAANDWWFLSGSGMPRAVSAPVVVKEGDWSGHPWQLVSYRSSTDGICWAIDPTGSVKGEGAAMACAPFVGIARTQVTEPSPGMTITYLSGSASDQLPAYIAGPVIEAAQQVEIHFGNGDVLRLPTFAAPESLGPVRFYATELPTGVAPTRPGPGQTQAVQKLAGLDANGNVVACLVPQTAVSGVSPLSDCR
jgi:hypothetical protein